MMFGIKNYFFFFFLVGLSIQLPIVQVTTSVLVPVNVSPKVHKRDTETPDVKQKVLKILHKHIKVKMLLNAGVKERHDQSCKTKEQNVAQSE